MRTVRPGQETSAHKLVYETAVSMAHELYDTMMSDNQWYGLWKAQFPGFSSKQLEGKFIARNIRMMLPQARATLAAMLARPIDPGLKDTIMEALLLDNSLKVGRGGKWVKATQVLEKN